MLFLVLATLTVASLGTVALAQSSIYDFTVSPDPPNQGRPATFTFQAPEGFGDADVDWDLDGVGGFEAHGEVVSHTYNSAGPVRVRMRVEPDDDDERTRTVIKTITVNGRPVVDFSFDPVSPADGQEVHFDEEVSDPEGDAIVALAWNFGDGEKATGPEPVHSYAEPGEYTVVLRATDSHGATRSKSREIVVRADGGPTSGFRFVPTVPTTGEIVTFTSTSEASQGEITEWSWDFDDDGEFDDFSGSTARWSFGTPGIHRVRLRVEQSNGKRAVSEENIRVNGAPSAAFTWNPFSPIAGDFVDLVSTSTDFEGPLASLSWDLDGDGRFGDGSEPRIRHPFTAPGAYDIGLRVTDSDGRVSTVRNQIVVLAAGGSGPPVGGPGEPPAVRRLRLISPFPVVRIAGVVLPHGARVRILSVRTPRGSRIRVRCRGRGCPVGSVARTSATRVVRFPKFERWLRAGIRLQVFVRRAGRIGKYTRFRIRAAAPPKRADRCLYPGRARPAPCP